MFGWLTICIFMVLTEAPCVPGEAIVRFDSKLKQDASGVIELPASFGRLKDRFGIYDIELLIQGRLDELDTKYGFDRTYIVRFDGKEDVEEFVSGVSSYPDVEIAEPNHLYRLYLEPNDPRFDDQWHLQDIKCPQGWDLQTGGRDVVIAVVDAGIDTAHPDLNGNLWRNIDEVLDGNDTDGNGYPDDIVGWDWTGGDNDPTPTYFGFPGWPPDEDHGTWCNSIANAVTDNERGVAGVAYNVQMMGLRVTYPNEPGLISTPFAINAMHYARMNGAKVISNSWGGYYFSTPVNNAIQVAHEAGLVICAAAGNDRSETIHYPAGYDNVIAVGGTDQQNHSWCCGPDCGTNFGYWVDVCAPAVDLLGCDTDGEGSDIYESAMGTSGSCPQVAGLAALLFSKYPDSSNTFIENTIFETCDPIDDTLYENGKLGCGKINVFKALARYNYCWPSLCDFSVSDSINGNNNGRPEAGDTCRLTISLTNDFPWADASDLLVGISCPNPAIRFIDSTAFFSGLTSSDTLENTDELVFEILEMSPDWVTFTVSYLEATPSPVSNPDTFSFLVGFPLLLVDDDNGGIYEDKYINALDEIGIMYEYWDNEDAGCPDSGKISHHPVVVWFTGDDSTTTLTSEEQTSLGSYLESGGRLFLTGQNIAQDISGKSFLQDYLKCSFVSPSVSGNFVRGIEGDEVGDSLNILTGLNQTSRDGITAVGGADNVIFYDDTYFAGIKYTEGERRVVFFSFGLEGIIPHSAYSSKAFVMNRVITWLDSTLVPGIEEDDNYQLTISNEKLSVYPNPATSKITFILPVGQGFSLAKIRIYDIAGREIDSFTPKSDRFEYSVRDLSVGVYFYKIEGRSRVQGKFVVVR